MEAMRAARSLKAIAGALLAACAIALCAAMPGQAWADTYAAKIGDDGYPTLQAAVDAANSGAVIEIVAAGTYEMPKFKDKELTFKGDGSADIVLKDYVDPSWSQDLSGSTIHFVNLTIQGATENYRGLIHTAKVTYDGCDINNLRFLYAAEVEFNDCKFDSNGQEHSFWTYSAKSVKVTDCSFAYADRAVNCYGDTGSYATDIVFTGCDFTYKGASATPEGAVEVNSSVNIPISLSFESCTAPTKGKMWFNSQWDDEKGAYTTVKEAGAVTWPVYVAQIGDVKYTSLQDALDAAAAGTGEVTVEILSDIDLDGVDWNPVTVSGPGYPKITVNGNGHFITHLNDMLFAGTWAGKSGLIINDLTIKDSAIVNDKDDSKGTVGVGAFIGYPQASATITLSNCHLVDSSVEGGHWTGGLIGMAGGYNGNDGPVFMNLTITGCSVTGSTVTGKGSAGGVIGHGSCAAWTKLVIEDTTVSGNTITSTGSSTDKAGSVMGTLGAAGQPTTAAGETKTGGAFVEATVSGNTVTSNGTAITTIYGRQGTSTGVLTLTKGGSYDKEPINATDSWANPAANHAVTKLADGTWTVLPEKCTVTFNANGGSAVASATVAGGEPFAKPANPTREGYIFSGWYTDEALTVAYDFSAPATGDITLYAKWTESNAGGNAGGGTVDPGKGDTTDKTDSKSDVLAKTGDAAGMVAASAGIVLAAAGVIALIARRRAA